MLYFHAQDMPYSDGAQEKARFSSEKIYMRMQAETTDGEV